MSETMSAMWQPLTRVSYVQHDANPEIEIEISMHHLRLPDANEMLFAAQSGVVVIFRDSPLEAICALVEYLAAP